MIRRSEKFALCTMPYRFENINCFIGFAVNKKKWSAVSVFTSERFEFESFRQFAEILINSFVCVRPFPNPFQRKKKHQIYIHFNPNDEYTPSVLCLSVYGYSYYHNLFVREYLKRCCVIVATLFFSTSVFNYLRLSAHQFAVTPKTHGSAHHHSTASSIYIYNILHNTQIINIYFLFLFQFSSHPKTI